MLKLDGTIIYQPNRGLDFKKKNKINTLIINFPHINDLSRYYIKLIENNYQIRPFSVSRIPPMRCAGARHRESGCCWASRTCPPKIDAMIDIPLLAPWYDRVCVIGHGRAESSSAPGRIRDRV